MADLKGTIIAFTKRIVRARPQGTDFVRAISPFTEPSIEVDMDCAVCAGKGCSPLQGKAAGSRSWVQAMVQPCRLAQRRNTTPAQFSGFAFGMGPQRITMLKYAIDDIRQFWMNDLRFLKQF